MGENEQNLIHNPKTMADAEKKWEEQSSSISKDIEVQDEENEAQDEQNVKKVNRIVKLSKIIGIVVVVLCLIGFIYLFIKRITYKNDIDITAIPVVDFIYIKKGTIGNSFSVAGNILPNSMYYVPAKIDGDIKKVYVKNGDYVKKGDPIVDLDCDKEIEAAFIQYDAAKNTYERMKKLYETGDISKQNYEQVKAQYDGAKLAYDTKVEFSHVVAVADGKIERVDMTENTSIKKEHVFCFITTDNMNEINFSVTERVLKGLSVGDKVKIERENKKYDGYISNISTLINETSGLFDVKAVIVTNDVIPSGSIAKVTFSYEVKENVNILPNDVIYYENGIPYIYIIDNDMIIHKKYIDVGIENENDTEIITAISTTEKIVSTWSKDIGEGKKVSLSSEVK